MLKKLCNYLFLCFMLISLCTLLRYSNWPVIDLPPEMESLFIRPTDSDGILFNLSIGFIVSSVFYLMIVYYPDKIRRDKAKAIALSEFATVCTDAMVLIVLMYKNVSSEAEWDHFRYFTDDSRFFNDVFYTKIQLFDEHKEADTLLCYPEKPYAIITWNDKLQNDLADYVRRIDITVNRYLYLLEDEIVESALAFKNNNFITIYLGLPTNEFGSDLMGKNGIKYAERVPLHLLNNGKNGKRSPIFRVNDVSNNSNILKSYVDTLLKLRSYCYNTTGFQKDRAVQVFCKDVCGQYGIAIFDD